MSSPKLLDRVRMAIRARHYSRRTARAYVGWIRRFIVFHGVRHPNEMGTKEISRFLTHLATEQGVSSSTQNQALSALLFLYRNVLDKELPRLKDVVRAKPTRHLPVVLSRTEVGALLDALEGPRWIMATLLYGAGLRVLECARLRIKDLDFEQRCIVIRAGKGAKDRQTLFPDQARQPLRRHLDFVRRQHETDLEKGAGWVEMPYALARKYPNAGRDWIWQWVFPAARGYTDLKTRQRRRHHYHDRTAIKRYLKPAVEKAGIKWGRSKDGVTFHTFRHHAESRIMRSNTRKSLKSADMVLERSA